ncbi:MAG: cellulase family glycosylhydrolase [Bacteroidaceae bacterium]|nr:cellulase family glycosylhydrolase [Bacteroidaceae bacterium]
MKKILTLMVIVCLTTLQLMAQNVSNAIYGEWYAVSDKAPVTLTFRQDGTFSLVNEAFSGMTMEGKYVINEQAQPAHIDLTEMGTGMDGLGLVEVKGDDLAMIVSFGPKGYVQRPKKLDVSALDLSTRYFSMNRDKHTLDAANVAPATIPAEAKLAFERNQRLGAGICLNGVVDGNSFRGTIPDMPLTDAEVKAIADAGFKSVRLCATWTRHCMPNSPYTIDPAFLKKVDDIVERCLANHLAVSIDVHYYPYINMDDEDKFISYEENFNRLSVLWEQIATYFKDKPNDMVFFDLLNEPNMRMGADKWNETFNTLIKQVRKTNPDRTLIISTPNLGQHWSINQLELPADDWNLIVQVHYYLPHTFTHQGLSYAHAEGTEGTKWLGTEAERKPIEADLDYCYKWSQRNGRPIYVGEYGVIDDAEPASRARYMGYMKHEMEKRGFSSHIWGFREAFGFFNPKTHTFDEHILNALSLGEKPLP